MSIQSKVIIEIRVHSLLPCSKKDFGSLLCGGIAASNCGMISFAKFSNLAASGTYLKQNRIRCSIMITVVRIRLTDLGI